MHRRISWLCCVLLFGLMLSACSSDTTEELASSNEKSPDEVFTDFVTLESDSGLVQWKLSAPRANRYSKEKLVLLENPVIEFFSAEGELQTTLVSQSGEYSEETRDMLAFGNVQVESVDGDKLETDSLFWNNKLDKILSESFVKLTRGKDVITGRGLECDPNLNSVDIKRDVRAIIIDERGEIAQ
ncbi:MAG: LPS export ABC transporter periplasmic protein LptC [Candidatus Krumholzibacteria bacterium]|nr:LPS export ABC transporter periplasmic protein LptC [Candidatus Krumholzibacteria bacterium]